MWIFSNTTWVRGSRVVNLLSGRGLQKQANRFHKSFTHFSMTVLIHAWLCLVHLSIIWIFLLWCSFLHSFWNSSINNVIDSVVWHFILWILQRLYKSVSSCESYCNWRTCSGESWPITFCIALLNLHQWTVFSSLL
jgi:hypothetical protein